METLKHWCYSNKLSQATLSDSGAKVSLDGTSIDGNELITVNDSEGREVQYSIASIYLQILDPDQSLPKYRGACKQYDVEDPVKALDKPLVVGYFLGNGSAEPAAAPPDDAAAIEKTDNAESSKVSSSTTTEDKETPWETKRPRESSSSKHHDKHRKDRKRSSSSHHKDTDKHDKKKRRSLVTNEQLFSNLNVVVDKRAGEGKPGGEDQQNEVTPSATATTEDQKVQEFEAIRQALSPEGFQVTPDMLEKYKEVTETIISHEIPVGDSASVLRASSVGANLTRALNIFLETVNPNKSHSKKGGGVTPSRAKRMAKPYLIGKKPIILLPKGMTAPITILNGYDFFANARFIPRDAMMKSKELQANSKKDTIKRKMAGVGIIEYELLDNPRKLVAREDWERVVAVIVLGHSWQFKDWPGKYSNPVELFSKAFGFYIGMDGEKISPDLEGWACQRGYVHRDKRGLDSVTHASFWNSLDQWVRIHRPELLPQPE